MGGAADNMEKADEQLHKKMTAERAGNKCLLWCVVIAMLAVVILIFFGLMGDKGGDETTIIIEGAAADSAVDSVA